MGFIMEIRPQAIEGANEEVRASLLPLRLTLGLKSAVLAAEKEDDEKWQETEDRPVLQLCLTLTYPEDADDQQGELGPFHVELHRRLGQDLEKLEKRVGEARETMGQLLPHANEVTTCINC